MVGLVGLCYGASASLGMTPPMGWMNWEVFRCNVDCEADPTNCVNAALFRAHADVLVNEGYLSAGYDTVHVDDCWMSRVRDATGSLRGDSSRFFYGMAALGHYIHSRGLKFGLYTAESAMTCAGYPASKGREKIDAKTFASWGVDYLKVDGCGGLDYYATGYSSMGEALQNSGREIVYSCSWPAYIGTNESVKAWCYETMINIGCNLWRNYADIECNWGSLSSIIEYWGINGHLMANYAAPGHFNDPDMLIIGNSCITDHEARTQMAIWCIVAAPLIMGNDLRLVQSSHKAILLNDEAISINQDALALQGRRMPSNTTEGQIWIRYLHDGGYALGLYNPTSTPLNISFTFPENGLAGPMLVRDIWIKQDLGLIAAGFNRTVAGHDTHFFKLIHGAFPTLSS